MRMGSIGFNSIASPSIVMTVPSLTSTRAPRGTAKFPDINITATIAAVDVARRHRTQARVRIGGSLNRHGVGRMLAFRIAQNRQHP